MVKYDCPYGDLNKQNIEHLKDSIIDIKQDHEELKQEMNHKLDAIHTLIYNKFYANGYEEWRVKVSLFVDDMQKRYSREKDFYYSIRNALITVGGTLLALWLSGLLSLNPDTPKEIHHNHKGDSTYVR
jgi:dihydroxyacetone kinase-like predicted kinase